MEWLFLVKKRKIIWKEETVWGKTIRKWLEFLPFNQFLTENCKYDVLLFWRNLLLSSTWYNSVKENTLDSLRLSLLTTSFLIVFYSDWVITFILLLRSFLSPFSQNSASASQIQHTSAQEIYASIPYSSWSVQCPRQEIAKYHSTY